MLDNLHITGNLQLGGPGGQQQPDFYLEFYKAHRAHEVALNTATAAYEQSLLRLVLVFNGAAFTALLGLMQATDNKGNIAYDFRVAHFALYIWAAGTLLAFLATFLAYLSQRHFTQAFRNRRQAEEVQRVYRTDRHWKQRLGIQLPTQPKASWWRNVGSCVLRVLILLKLRRPPPARPGPCSSEPCLLLLNADKERDDARVLQRAAIGFGFAAILAAAIGFIVAASSIHQGPNAPNLWKPVSGATAS